MISNTYDINDFIAKTVDMPFEDFILLSDQEATEAERSILKRNGGAVANFDKIRSYADTIKALIRYARYEICTGRGVDSINRADLDKIKAKSYTTLI